MVVYSSSKGEAARVTPATLLGALLLNGFVCEEGGAGSLDLRNGMMVMNSRSSRNQVGPMLATLSDLLAPVSLSEFLEGFRARRRLHISASDPTRAETLLSQDINTLLSAHGLGENVGMWRDGVLVPRQFYTSNGGKQIKVRAFHDLLAQGVSIVVEKVDRSIPQISQLAAAIERERWESKRR
jgi:hypothetical protein